MHQQDIFQRRGRRGSGAQTGKAGAGRVRAQAVMLMVASWSGIASTGFGDNVMASLRSAHERRSYPVITKK
jgi:hypothetical protein